jgi:hypothetical protein
MSVVITEDCLDLKAQAYPQESDRKASRRVFITNPTVSPRVLTTVLIVCGNCAGEEDLPRKTFATPDGCCSDCGSRNYFLASKLVQMTRWRQIYEFATESISQTGAPED